MNKKILVSILCVTYNHEKFIRNALDSFLMQRTNFDFEILIHDDASTDNTTNIIKEYEKKYPALIKVIYQTENQYSKGISPAIYLYEKAQGKYLAMCEGDDFWIDNKKLQKQIDFLEKNKDYYATYHNVLVVDEKNRLNPKEQGSFPLIEEEDYEKEEIEIYNLIGQLCSIVARNFWITLTEEEKKSYEVTKANGDEKLLLIFTNFGKIKFFKDIMGCYRRSYTNGSWNAKNKNKNLLEINYDSTIELKKMVKTICKKDITIEDELNIFLLKSMLRFIKTRNKNDFKIFFKILKKNRFKHNFISWFFKRSYNFILFKLNLKNKKNKRTPYRGEIKYWKEKIKN